MILRARHHSSHHGSRGQALVEFALVMPIFLALVFGLFDIARVIWANDMMASAAREGARWASVHGDSLATTPATKDEIRAYTLSRLVGAGTAAAVTVCYSSVQLANSTVGCTGDTDEAGTTPTRGALVTVTITSSVPIITGGLIGLADFTVHGSSTVLVNN
jgi:Flp pilus assembly protein TadG